MSPDGTRVAIGLGGNLGDRLGFLEFGRRALETLLTELKVSSVYDTAPAGVLDQPRFLNACCTGHSTLAAPDLLARLKAVEREAGRSRRGHRFGPRVLDLDLLLYGSEILRTEELAVPHPRLHERSFVLVPLSEIAPDWVHPVLDVTIDALCRDVGSHGVVRTAWTLGGTPGAARGGEDDAMEDHERA